MKKTALLIFGWNRPHYMQMMLKTVRRNKKLDTFVYLDYCQDVKKTQILISLCNLYIPYAKIIVRQKRYGCQNNIDCARLQAFNNGYDRIIVLQDDFLISDNYFTLLQNALDWCQNNCPKICMVIGWTGHNNYKTYKDNKFQPYQLSFSRQHMLGYIMNKYGWNKMYEPYYKKYMQITKDCLIDYDICKLNQLKCFFRKLPVNINKTQQWKNNFRNQRCYGQDRATVACMYAAGLHRANFDLSRLQYIGYVGLHANIKDSINFGWNNVKMSQITQDAYQKEFKLSQQLKQLCFCPQKINYQQSKRQFVDSFKIPQYTDDIKLQKKIPVLFRTYNRLQYLYYTLCSFFSTNAKEKCSVQIVDDCSQEKQMQKFLYTNEKLDFQFDMTKDKRFQSYKDRVLTKFNKLQPIKGLCGLGKSIDVIKPQCRKGDKGGLLWTIKNGFQRNKDSQFIIILQSDVVFEKQWLNSLLHIYQQNKNTAGIISCWNRRPDNLRYTSQKNGYLKLAKGQCLQFQVSLITRKFYQKLMQTQPYIFEKQYKFINDQQTKIQRQKKKNDQQYNIAGDWFLFGKCYQLGFDAFTTKKSYLQHIGVGSVCRFWQKTDWLYSQLFDGQFQCEKLNVGNVYIFSNVYCKGRLNVKPNDILVFINDAVAFEQYKYVCCKKLYFKRFLVSRNIYAGRSINADEIYYVCGKNNNLPITYEQLSKQYDYNYKTTAITKEPTTGWLVYNLCKIMFPYHNIKLVNFFPNSDFTTTHDSTHNWLFEDSYYKENNVDIIDLRNTNIFSKKELYQQLHKKKSDYGSQAHRFSQKILNIINENGFNSILDYGCGKATLSKHIIASKPNVQFYNYDFAIQEYNKFPHNKKFDLCTCIDVLQHVPENQLHLVFKQILSVSNNCFFNISCRTACNKLPNGQNCHCTVHNQQWWLQFLKKYFDSIIKIDSESNELTCFVCKKIDDRG